MILMILDNLLTGQVPDAVGLMVFGFVMVGSSMLLRRVLGEDAVAEAAESNEDGVLGE